MKTEEAKRIAMGLRTDFKCESDTMVDFCNTIIKALEQEPCEDCVSRADLKKWLDMNFSFGGATRKLELFDRLDKELPPVTLPNSKMELVKDCISRQAALDVIEREQFKGDAISEIEKLPPVTPTSSKIEQVEQEPFINKPCVSSGVCEHDKQKILDKIRAEIEQHRRKTQGIDPYDLVGDCLDIIDEYKESEE